MFHCQQFVTVIKLDLLTVHCAMSMAASVLAMCTSMDFNVTYAYQDIIISHQMDVFKVGIAF